MPPITGRRHLRMPEHHEHEDESVLEQMKRLVLDNIAAFLAGWILGAGLGRTLWDSVTGVV